VGDHATDAPRHSGHVFWVRLLHDGPLRRHVDLLGPDVAQLGARIGGKEDGQGSRVGVCPVVSRELCGREMLPEMPRGPQSY